MDLGRISFNLGAKCLTSASKQTIGGNVRHVDMNCDGSGGFFVSGARTYKYDRRGLDVYVHVD